MSNFRGGSTTGKSQTPTRPPASPPAPKWALLRVPQLAGQLTMMGEQSVQFDADGVALCSLNTADDFIPAYPQAEIQELNLRALWGTFAAFPVTEQEAAQREYSAALKTAREIAAQRTKELDQNDGTPRTYKRTNITFRSDWMDEKLLDSAMPVLRPQMKAVALKQIVPELFGETDNADQDTAISLSMTFGRIVADEGDQLTLKVEGDIINRPCEFDKQISVPRPEKIREYLEGGRQGIYADPKTPPYLQRPQPALTGSYAQTANEALQMAGAENVKLKASVNALDSDVRNLKAELKRRESEAMKQGATIQKLRAIVAWSYRFTQAKLSALAAMERMRQAHTAETLAEFAQTGQLLEIAQTNLFACVEANLSEATEADSLLYEIETQEAIQEQKELRQTTSTKLSNKKPNFLYESDETLKRR